MKTLKAIELLEAACRYATLETAGFQNINAGKDRRPKFRDGRLVTEDNVDEFIRERVRLHHQTWIIGPMEEVLTLLREEAGRRKKAPRDPTPWCTACGAKRPEDDRCGPIADNE